jgi:2'-5' RNA ligase
MAQSALILPVPEAEPVVARLRERFDPAARLGVPAHVTLLFPFASPERITAEMLRAARAVVGSTRSFSFRLARIERFPDTLYLGPEPAAPFVALTEALARQLPEYPPYAGEFDSIIPHLTVAHGTQEELRAAERELRAAWPESGLEVRSCGAVSLIENSSGRWEPLAELPFEGPRASP